MKTSTLLLVLTAGAIALVAPRAPAGELNPNRLSVALRVPFQVQAEFSGTLSELPGSSRTTPDGARYNYDDGYVFNDVSGSGDGLTWYWGYDDAAAQVAPANNAIRFSRTTGSATVRAPKMDDEPAPGVEVTYARELRREQVLRYGFELALNWVGWDMASGGSYRAQGTRVVDSYAFTPGTTPPGATPGSPYQGTFEGPGFVIANTPFASSSQSVPIGTVTGSRRLEADLWGGRLGPNLEWALDERVIVSLSAGLAVGFLDAQVHWDETLTLDSGGVVADAGRGSDEEWCWGWYAAASVHWQFSPRWTAFAGAQYQDLGKYKKEFGNRRVELDLSHALFVGLGISWSF